MIYAIGIDPGKSGGIAIVMEEAGRGDAIRYPGDIPACAKFIQMLRKDYGQPGLAIIEKVHSMPKQGVSSSFTFGENFGAWQGIMAARNIPYLLVTPQTWQKVMLKDAPKKGRSTKERSLEVARQLFPHIDLRYKADDGKADALHMARYGMMLIKEGRA